MKEPNNPFRKVGIFLLVIGIIDIGVMAYCIAKKISYSSSFNIFAVIAGVLLIRGGVKTARVVRWLSAFIIISFIGMLFLFPIAIPIDLLITQLKLDPVDMLGPYAFAILLVGILIWVYLQLSSYGALEKLKQAGYKTGKPKSALYAALAIMVFVGVMFAFLFNSKSAAKAKALAEEQLGASYKYHIGSLSISGNSGSAEVTAYNENEIKAVNVKW